MKAQMVSLSLSYSLSTVAWRREQSTRLGLQLTRSNPRKMQVSWLTPEATSRQAIRDTKTAVEFLYIGAAQREAAEAASQQHQ